MRKTNSLLHSLAASLLALSPACFVVDDGALKEARGNAGDGGMDGGADSVAAADQCGDPTTPMLKSNEAMQTARVDTTNLSAFPTNLTASCAGVGGTPGNDGFLRLDVQAGQYFHFHVQSLTASRDPVVYMLPTNCDTTTCGLSVANRCGVGQDEHFGFRFSSNGTWYLGIDDKMSGGGEYLVGAYRPTCGNGVKEHGEGCDKADPNPAAGEVCDSQCRRVLTGTPTEVEINDDLYWANAIDMTSGAVEVSGNLLGTCDPDVYAFNAAANQRVIVTEKPSGAGTLCHPANPMVQMRILSAGGAVKFNGMLQGNASGCLIFDHTFTAQEAGQYFVELAFVGTPAEAVVPYVLRFE